MRRSTLKATLLALPLLLVGVPEAFAWTKSFPGTRDQVRAACSKFGGSLHEDSNGSTCVAKNSNVVSCNDAGDCAGSGSGPMPRIAVGSVTAFGNVLTASTPRIPPVPESLTSGSSGGSASGGAGASGGIEFAIPSVHPAGQN